MFDALHIVGDRAFEVRTEAHTTFVVRTYTLTDDMVELDPTELEFPSREFADIYIENMVNRLKGGKDNERD